MINENDPSTLSTSGRLMSYNDAVKEGLKTGEHFTELMDQLINTKDPKVLLDAAQELSIFVLDSDYVTFPHQYNNADFYLIFMSRLLELHDQGDAITLQSHENDQHLTQQITALGDLGSFAFTSANDSTGGVYYQDKVTSEVPFYLNLQRRLMRINSEAITKLFVETYVDKIDQDNLLAATNLLISFGQALKTDFGFDVDFNLLDTNNNEFYAFTTSDLSGAIVDKLFVAAASENYMLQHDQDGAVLQLPGEVTLKIASHNATGAAAWGMYVQDKAQQVSWFTLLLEYPFLRNWYLDDLLDLQIKSDSLVFSR